MILRLVPNRRPTSAPSWKCHSTRASQTGAHPLRVGRSRDIPAEPSKNLLERRAELEKQLRELTDRGDPLYMPGMTIVPGQLSATEQTELQIEELQAAIAEIDEELKQASKP